MVDKTEKAPKAKRQMKPRSQYIVFQVLGADGQPAKFDKENFKLLKFTRKTDELLDLIESGQYPNAVYKKVTV